MVRITPIYKSWSSAIWKGSHNPILRGQQLTIVANYFRPWKILQVYHIHSLKLTNILLVGGFNPPEKIFVKLDHLPNFRGESQTKFKPPPSFSGGCFLRFFHHFVLGGFFTQPTTAISKLLGFPNSRGTPGWIFG